MGNYGEKMILYLSRTSIREPLGQGQVLSYLKGLASEFAITIVSVEGKSATQESASIVQLRRECDAHSIRWLRIPVPQVSRSLRTLIEVAGLIIFALVETGRGDTRLLHARSLVPAFVALVVSKIRRIPFVFDTRAFWVEELLATGRVRSGSWLHRLVVKIELSCLENASSIVCLTDAAADRLLDQLPTRALGSDLVVIPTCADLERFRPPSSKPRDSGDRVYSAIGSILSGWFNVEMLVAFFNALALEDKHARFEIVTRDNPVEVRAKVSHLSNFEGRLKIFSTSWDEVHEVIGRHTASALFYEGGLSSLGRSPTRMAEILGCGVPIVASAGVGDLDVFLAESKVGVLLSSSRIEDIASATRELQVLLADPDLSRRCRQEAENHFSLESGIAKYELLYRNLLCGQ